ncbi:MAG TPA: amidohydrolase, partial [Phenylobacterium sp.]|nr:amidohydrolase [Phenylobacterium sp.]
MRLALASALALLASSAVAAPAKPASPADLVIWGGPIYTAARPGKVEAVAVKRGRIAYVGGRAGAAAEVGPQTRVIDLAGAALFPGFTDS